MSAGQPLAGPPRDGIRRFIVTAPLSFLRQFSKRRRRLTAGYELSGADDDDDDECSDGDIDGLGMGARVVRRPAPRMLGGGKARDDECNDKLSLRPRKRPISYKE